MNLFTHKCHGHNVVLRELEPCPHCVDDARAKSVAAAGPRRIVFTQLGDGGRTVSFHSAPKLGAAVATYKPLTIKVAEFDPPPIGRNAYVDFIKRCEDAITRELSAQFVRAMKGWG